MFLYIIEEKKKYVTVSDKLLYNFDLIRKFTSCQTPILNESHISGNNQFFPETREFFTAQSLNRPDCEIRDRKKIVRTFLHPQNKVHIF